jgi:hypothetical protein
MTPLTLSLYPLLHVNIVAPAPRVDSSVWQPVPALVGHANPLASVPSQVVLSHTKVGTWSLAPAGVEGPPPAPAFDALSATTRYDQLKADRMLGLKAVGGGVVLTLTEF